MIPQYKSRTGEEIAVNLSPYRWQTECIETWLEHGGRGIVQVVTGAGKTFMALGGFRELDKVHGGCLKVRIILPKLFMVKQWRNVILEQGGSLGISRKDIGIWQGSHKDSPDRKIMLYVINSARQTFSLHMLALLRSGAPVLIIADECHHYASEENRRIFEFIPGLRKEQSDRLYTIGLSATPQTEDFERILVPALGPLIFSYDFSDAIRQQIITGCVLYRVGIALPPNDLDLYERLTFAINKLTNRLKKRLMPKHIDRQDFLMVVRRVARSQDMVMASDARKLLILLYKRRAVLHESTIRIDCTLDIIDAADPTSKIIIFTERIRQTEELFLMLEARYPGEVVRYHSQMGEQAKSQAMERYKFASARILVCCKALDEGFDVPAADIGIITSGTSAERQRVQRLGRIVRKSEGKDLASLFLLYLMETVEDDGRFLDNQEGLCVQELYYSDSSATMRFPRYDDLVNEIIEVESSKQLPENHMMWLKAFLGMGKLRTDWLLDVATLEHRAEQAKNRSEHNYLICMVRMARLRVARANGTC